MKYKFLILIVTAIFGTLWVLLFLGVITVKEEVIYRENDNLISVRYDFWGEGWLYYIDKKKEESKLIKVFFSDCGEMIKKIKFSSDYDLCGILIENSCKYEGKNRLVVMSKVYNYPEKREIYTKMVDKIDDIDDFCIFNKTVFYKKSNMVIGIIGEIVEQKNLEYCEFR